MNTFKPIGDANIEAFQWTGGALGARELPHWAQALGLHTPGDDTLHVPTHAGTTRAVPGDWVVRAVDGSVHVMPHAAFTAQYEPFETPEEKKATAAAAKADAKADAADAKAAQKEPV